MSGSKADMHAAEGKHIVIVPIFGKAKESEIDRLCSLGSNEVNIYLIDNRSKHECGIKPIRITADGARVYLNHNVGLVAGGLNMGVEKAICAGASVITFLDQDSQLGSVGLVKLRESLTQLGPKSILGPRVVDEWRSQDYRERQGLSETRMLISSGTTFVAAEWESLGRLHEGLGIDLIDHHWCFRAGSRGFRFYVREDVLIQQRFGQRHPNRLCHALGMQLYPPERHYRSIRNLKWLIRKRYVPVDFKVKEVIKMMIKSAMWLTFEKKRQANATAIVEALTGPQPDDRTE